MATTQNQTNPSPNSLTPTHPSPTSHTPHKPPLPINPHTTNQEPNHSNSIQQNPNTQNPNTRESDRPPLHYQLDQIATVMAQIIHRLDVMEERYAREEYDPSNQHGRRGVHRAGEDPNDANNIHKNEEENLEYEDHEPRVCHPRQYIQGVHMNHGAGY